MIARIDPARPFLSIVAPCFNESGGLEQFHRRLVSSIDPATTTLEIIYVNDGSVDDTLDVIRTLQATDPRVGIINLSRNFGKEAALTAGIDHASGDAVIVIDTDLQDPPERIPDMLMAWQRGFDVVAMKRADRSADTLGKRLAATCFYRVLSCLSPVQIPENVGDFRLLSRRAVNAVRSMPERNRYMKGLFAWIGFRTIELEYRREPRHDGESKWPFLSLFGLAVDGIVSFSIAPLRIASLAGACAACGAVLYGLFVLAKTLLFGDPAAGFPTLIVMITFLGGAQLMATGLLGEYVGRLLIESKQRPHYFVDQVDLPIQQATVARERLRGTAVR